MEARDYLDNVRGIADSVSVQDIDNVVDILYDVWAHGGVVYLCGNGGSASTASHFACDLLKIGLKIHCLNDNPAIITAITNDNGFDNLYLEQIKNLIGTEDALICISVHGGMGKDKAGMWSQNLLRAMDCASKNGAKTIGLAGFDGGAMASLADARIIINAYSTPQVESWHLHIAHLICLLLGERIR